MVSQRSSFMLGKEAPPPSQTFSTRMIRLVSIFFVFPPRWNYLVTQCIAVNWVGVAVLQPARLDAG